MLQLYSNYRVRQGVRFCVVNNRTHWYLPLPAFTRSDHCTSDTGYKENTAQQMLSGGWRYTANGPFSKSVSSEVAPCIYLWYLCHLVGLFSQLAVSPSCCHSVLLHPLFRFTLGLHPSFYTSGFSPIVLQKNGKSCVRKGSICLISSSKMTEWVTPCPCCHPPFDPSLSPKSQENKLVLLSWICT